MLKKLNALRARQNLGQVLEEVFYKGDRYVIERAGKPMAAVVPVWLLKEYEESKGRVFEAVRRAQQRNKRAKPEVVERKVAEAVTAVRGRKKRR